MTDLSDDVVSVAIDPNVRVWANQTFTGLEDADGPVEVGLVVRVHEPESGLSGSGRIVSINRLTRLMYLDVDWSSL